MVLHLPIQNGCSPAIPRACSVARRDYWTVRWGGLLHVRARAAHFRAQVISKFTMASTASSTSPTLIRRQAIDLKRKVTGLSGKTIVRNNALPGIAKQILGL